MKKPGIDVIVAPADFSASIKKIAVNDVKPGQIYFVPRGEYFTPIKSKEQYESEIRLLKKQIQRSNKPRYVTRTKRYMK